MSPLVLWHQNIETWHGPITRISATSVWDARTRKMVSKVVEYRGCGCVLWKDAP